MVLFYSVREGGGENVRDSFSLYHPFINFFYFAVVILFSMFFMHPVFLGISLVGSITYSMLLNGRRAVKFNFLYMIPMLLLIALINRFSAMRALQSYFISKILLSHWNPFCMESRRRLCLFRLLSGFPVTIPS